MKVGQDFCWVLKRVSIKPSLYLLGESEQTIKFLVTKYALLFCGIMIHCSLVNNCWDKLVD